MMGRTKNEAPTGPTTTLEKVHKAMTGELAGAREYAASYAKKLAENPYDALQWVGDLPKEAATVRVFTEVVAAIDGGKVNEEIIRAHANEMIRRLGSRGAIKSSGFLDNQLHAEEIRAWVRVLTLIDQYA